MANDRNLHVNLSVKADTSEAKAAFQDLQNTLSKLGTMQNVRLGQNISKDILEASNAALSLQQQLKAATNVNTGKLDLSVLKKNLENSGQSLASYREQLTKLGPDGEQAFMKVASSIASAELPLKKTNTALTEFLGTLKNTARWQISSSILHGFMGSLQSAYGYAQDLNRSLNDIQIVTQHSTEYMAAFADKANKAAKELSTTTTAYTNASLIFYQQGLSDDEVQKRTDVTIKMANASRQSAEEVSSQLTAIWNNFADGSKSLEYYADVLTKLGATTASSSSEISEGLQKFASIGETVGLSYEYAASALATITATSRESADTVGNALKTLFARIQSLKLGDTLEDGVDLNKYSEAIEKVGVHVLDTNGELRDMDAILDDLMERWDNLDRTAQTALAQTVAGQRQYAQFMTLMNNSDFFRQNVETAKGSEGSLQEQADIYAESWEAAQKRVKAAAQAIYQDLLDDKFFITILNGFEKVLTGIDGFIDSIGGLKTLVPAVGALFLTLFKDQIGKGLENAIHNIAMLSDQGKQAYKDMQKAAVREIYDMNNGSDSAVLQSTAKSYERIGQLYETLIDEADQMSDFERETAEELIKRQQTYEELVKKSGEELDNARAIARESASAVYSEANKNGISRKDYAGYYSKLDEEVQRYTNSIKILEDAEKALQNDQGMTKEQITALEQALKSLNPNLVITEDDMNLLSESSDKAKVMLKLLAATLGGDLEAAGKLFAQSTKTSDEAVNQLIQDLVREQQAFNAEQDSIKQAETAHEQATQAMREHAAAAANYAQSFTGFLGGVSSVVGGINALSRAVDTFKDKEKDFGEKVLSGLSGISMGLPMLITGISSLKTNFAGAGKFIGESFKTIGSAAVSVLGSLGLTGWITIGAIAGLTLIGVVLGKISEGEKSNLEKLQEEHKKVSKIASEAQSAADKLNQKYKTTSSLISSYDEAKKALDNCTVGTDEWHEALKGVNDSLSEILKQAPELAQFIDSEGNLDLKQAREYQQQVERDSLIAGYAADLASLQLQQIEVNIDKEKMIEDVADSFGKGVSLFQRGFNNAMIITDNDAGSLGYGWSGIGTGYQTLEGSNYFELDETFITQLQEDISNGVLKTQEEIRDRVVQHLIDLYGTIIDPDKDSYVTTIIDDVEDSTKTVKQFFESVVDTNFKIELQNYSLEVNKAEENQREVNKLLDVMCSSAINYITKQDDSIKSISNLTGLSEDIVRAYMANALPEKIQESAENIKTLASKSEQSAERYFNEYLDFIDENYTFQEFNPKTGEIKYKDGEEEGSIFIDTMSQFISASKTLSGDFEEIFGDIEQSLNNIVTKGGIEFATWLSDTDKEFSNLKGSEISQLQDRLGGNLKDIQAIETALEDMGIVASDWDFETLNDMAKALFDSYDHYNTQLEEFYASVPNTVEDQLRSIADDYNSSEIKEIGNVLVKAMAEGGMQAEEEIFKILMSHGVKNATGIAEELNNINWETMSIDDFVDQMVELEYITPEAANNLGQFLDQIESIAEADLYTAVDSYKAGQDAITSAESGKNLTSKQYEALDPETKQLYTMVADGSYALKTSVDELKTSVDEVVEKDFAKSMENAVSENIRLHNIQDNIKSDENYYSNFLNENGKYSINKMLEGLDLLEWSGFADSEQLEEWRSLIKDENSSLNTDQIKEIESALQECAEQGFGFLDAKVEESNNLLETNKNVLLSTKGTYDEFAETVNNPANGISNENGEAQALWELIGFDPTTLKDAEDLLKQVEEGHLKTSQKIKEGWDEVKDSTDVLSKEDFNTLLESMEETEDKMSFTEDAAKKVKWSFEDLGNLEQMKTDGLLSEKTWESIIKDIDLTGVSLSDLKSAKDNIPVEIFEQWRKKIVESTDSFSELNAEVDAKTLEREEFSKQFKEILGNGDSTTEDAILSLKNAVEEGLLSQDQADDFINDILDNKCTSTEEKLAALLLYLNEMPESAGASKKAIDEILNDPTLNMSHKADAIFAQDENQNSIYPAKMRADAAEAIASKVDISSLEHSESFINDWRAAVEEAFQAGEYAGDQYKEALAQVAQAQQDLTDKTKDNSGLEQAVNLLNDYSIKITDENALTPSGKGIAPEYWAELGASLKEASEDMEGLTAREKYEVLSQILAQFGLNCEDVNIKMKDLSDSMESLDINENFTSMQNLISLQGQLGQTGNLKGYAEAIDQIMDSETDLTVAHEDLFAELVKTGASFAKQVDDLRGNTRQTDIYTKALAEATDSLDDMRIAMEGLRREGISEEKILDYENQTLIKIGKSYESCQRAAEKYENTLRKGNKASQDLAKSQLELKVNCAKAADEFGLNTTQVEALAQSYQELYTQEDQAGNVTKISGEMAADLAVRNINLNNAISDLKDNWWEYEASLLDVIMVSEDGEEVISGNAESLEKMRESVAQLMNVTDASLISTEFMRENFDLLKAAAEGAGWAVDELQTKFAQKIEAEITVNDQPFYSTIDGANVYLSDWINSLPEGEIKLDDDKYLDTLINAMYYAGYSADQIKESLSGMGIEVDLEPLYEGLEEAVNVGSDAGQQLLNIADQTQKEWVKGAREASDEVVDELGITVEGETGTAEATGQVVASDITATTSTKQAWGVYYAPRFGYNENTGDYVAETYPIQYANLYPVVDYTVENNPQPVTETKGIVGYRARNARKTSGGVISAANRQPIKQPFRARNDSPRQNSGGGGGGGGTPSTQSVRVTPASGYTRRESYRRQEHRQEYHNPVRLQDYLIDEPTMTHTELLHTPDKVKSKRTKWRNVRNDEKFEAPQKEYETLDPSTFKNIDDEIDRYHDINRELTNIGYRLDEINQRKSRAFGKAHIDAIQEEGEALKEQLAAQEKYISQMADRRTELQDQMKNEGWEFDENGSITNFTEHQVQDVLTHNAGKVEVNTLRNQNRTTYNENMREGAAEASEQMDEVYADYNERGEYISTTANTERAGIDDKRNNFMLTGTQRVNENLIQIDEDEYAQNSQIYGNYITYATGRISTYNNDIGTEDNRFNAGNVDAETNHELGWNRIQNENGQRRETDANWYNGMTGGLEGTYESDVAKNIQDFIGKVNDEYKERQQKTDDWFNWALDENDNMRDEALFQNEEYHTQKINSLNYNFENDMNDNMRNATSAMKKVSAAAEEQRKGILWDWEEDKGKMENWWKDSIDEVNEWEDDQNWENEENFKEGQQNVRDWWDDFQKKEDKRFAKQEDTIDLMDQGVDHAYEQSQKIGQEYDTLDDTMSQAMLEAQELRNKIYDNAIEVIEYTLSLNVQISSGVLAALEALLGALGDSADKAADRIAVLGQKMYQFSYQTTENLTAIKNLINSTGTIDDKVLTSFMNGNFSEEILKAITDKDLFTADKISLIEQMRDSLASLIAEQRALRDQMFENVMGAFNEYQDSLSNQIEKMTSLTKITETYQNIIGIVGKKVMDVSGELSKSLNKTAFETQRSQTAAYKAILDEIDANIAGLQQQKAIFEDVNAKDKDGNSLYDPEMAAEYQKRIDEMESKRREAEANWLSSWEAEMEAATNYYADAIDTITMTFDRSISGLIGSLELLSKEYERQQKIQNVYVEDYEKIYQLSKLTRDVQNAIDDSDHVRNKQKLKKLQEEINAANNTERKMSQYDLDVLRKKFELELARSELEESRNAKSQVRMMRDSEGNFGYVYTADANEVAKAEQNYEDKLHELQVLNTEYIKELENNYIELQQNVRDEIAALDISQFATEEEYLAEVERIQKAAIQLQQEISEQWQGALNNNKDLYDNDWQEYHDLTGYKISENKNYLDQFGETVFAALTGYKTLEEASALFEKNLGTMCDSVRQVYQETMGYIKEALGDGLGGEENASFESFGQKVKETTSQVTKDCSELAKGAQEMAGSFETAFGKIIAGAQAFAERYVTEIQPVINSNLNMMNGLNSLTEYQANNPSEEGGKASGTVRSGQSWNAFATGTTGGVKIESSIGGLLPFISTLFQFGSPEDNYLGWGSGQEREKKVNAAFGETASKEINEWLGYNATGNSIGYWLSMQNNLDKYKAENFVTTDINGKIVKLDTGGYTGDWNSIEGKIAMLHEKELVLNQQDTKNILEAVDMVRKITQTIDLNALSASSIMSDILTATNINPSNSEVLQQEVHITADFPNATDRDEIIAAFDNLTNLAMQYAGKSQNFM